MVLANGRKDSKGRSLRDLDLKDTLFEYPLSYMIYTPHFEALPVYTKDYVYRRLAAILQGDDPQSRELSRRDRRAVLEILEETKPEILSYLEG